MLIQDDRFKVQVIERSQNPNRTIFLALSCDYSEDYIGDGLMVRSTLTSEQMGEIIVRRLLSGGKGHFGCLEHGSITFSVGGYPHSVMQQARTHRVGVSFDVQSGRYTGERIERVGRLFSECQTILSENSSLIKELEDVFYLRPAGKYKGRTGRTGTYTEDMRIADLAECGIAAASFAEKVDAGLDYELARSPGPFDVRQNFVVSFNPRSLMHFLDLRAKRDAQPEIQNLASELFSHFTEWMPEVAEYYGSARLGKARLSP